MPFHWSQVTLVLARADAYRGRRKVKDQWEEEPYEVEHQVAEGNPFLPHEEPADRLLMIPPLKSTFYHCSFSLYGHVS